MNININGEAVKEFKEFLALPPYLFFLFISSIFIITSLIWDREFIASWIFFLYSAVGSITRYIEKDLIGTTFTKELKNKNVFTNTVIIVYHVFNLLLFISLVVVLVKFDIVMVK